MAINKHSWILDEWKSLETATRLEALECGSNELAWRVINRQARKVLRSFSTSFFIVTRFLPPKKREQVEAIYAAVRYPDEIVDTFNLPIGKSQNLIDEWGLHYEVSLSIESLRDRLKIGVPCFLAGFVQVVREAGIPPEYYRAFLDAMRLDLQPRRFATLDDLIENYIYGSAIVVGYFLAYVYGPATGNLYGADFNRALKASRDLGIALQLTNFLRDVAEDQMRGRLYLPLDLLAREGLTDPDASDDSQNPAFQRVLKQVTKIAEDYYSSAASDLDAFSPDCRTAISACIDVYRQLNQQISNSPHGIKHRESVSMQRKFQVLPTSKYWRLPLAYLTQ